MSISINRKALENWRNRIIAKLVRNKKYYLKRTSKPSHMPHKIFDNNSVAKRKGELALKLNKPE